MKFLKIEDGKLELNDFILTSPATDFLGTNTYDRTPDKLTLKSGILERAFPYDDYVLIVEKEQVTLKKNEYHAIYVRTDEKRTGIIESEGLAGRRYKILKSNGFIQSYVDASGSWEAIGGGQERYKADIQGFQIEGTTPLTITKYELYRSPYLNLYEIEPNARVVIEDVNGDIVKTGIADTNGMVSIYLEDTITGVIKIYSNELLVYTSQEMVIQLGDGLLFVKRELDVIYNGTVLDHNPTKLNRRVDKIAVRNSSIADTYTDINVAVVNPSKDTILISLDVVDYQPFLTIPVLTPQETKDIYVKIIRDQSTSSIGLGSFSIELD